MERKYRVTNENGETIITFCEDNIIFPTAFSLSEDKETSDVVLIERIDDDEENG